MIAPSPAGHSGGFAKAPAPARSERSDCAAGQSVLITGAGGGVGSYAVQLARSMDAEVTGVCCTAKAACGARSPPPARW